jgi:hypothetical protein
MALDRGSIFEIVSISKTDFMVKLPNGEHDIKQVGDWSFMPAPFVLGPLVGFRRLSKNLLC